MYAQQKPAMTYLDDLPATSKLVVELLLRPGDDSSVVTLLHSVFSADNDLLSLGISEKKHLLRSESDDEDRNLIFKDFASRNLASKAVNAYPRAKMIRHIHLLDGYQALCCRSPSPGACIAPLSPTEHCMSVIRA